MTSPTTLTYLGYSPTALDAATKPTGGPVVVMLANGIVNTGDCVFIASATKVGKSTTQADYVGFIGVVVGGASTSMRVPLNAAGTQMLSGVAATAADGDAVIIQTSGIAIVVAGAGITSPARVIPSGAVAGQVLTSADDKQSLGISLDTVTTLGDTLRIFFSAPGFYLNAA